jgi:antitoxin ParD1/3/4
MNVILNYHLFLCKNSGLSTCIHNGALREINIQLILQTSLSPIFNGLFWQNLPRSKPYLFLGVPMTTMNISLPETLKDFVDTQVLEQGYSTSSEYVRALIRNDQIKQAEQRLAALLLDGLESGPAIPVDEDYWNNKQAVLKRQHFAR